VCCQITFSGSHLVDSPSNEFAQAHKRPRIQRGRIQVVPRGWEKGVPLHSECLSIPLLQGGVSVVHQGLGLEDGGRAHMVGVDHGHPRKPENEGYCPVSHCVNWQVGPHRGDRAGRFPM